MVPRDSHSISTILDEFHQHFGLSIPRRAYDSVCVRVGILRDRVSVIPFGEG